MERCKHQRGDLYEHFKSSWIQFFENGTLVQAYAEIDEGYPTGGITFYCRDCQKRFTFKDHRKAPKWLQKYYADFLAHGKTTPK